MEDAWKIIWTDSESEYELNFSDGEAVLEHIKKLHTTTHAPTPIVEVVRLPSQSPSLSIAVGHPETVLTFEMSPDPPYYISLGSEDRTGTSPLFIHGGQGIEHLARNLIPWDRGLLALEDFLSSENQPQSITWERI